MKQSITIHVDDEPVEITIGSARKEDSIRRAELMNTAARMEPGPLSMVAFYLYPVCVCSVREPESAKYMSLDDFVSKVDDADLDAWAAKAYELNPHWKQMINDLGKVDEAEKEKKILTPSPGSSTPTETTEKTLEISPT
jgi:hypothetical protein